ncbi:hypothetical protein GGF41_000190 [Coemansia sp. RSA 2531]|nr:hypothetical protein GGF41_000190 [Coemansia sp. RSA 2531]
MIEALTKTCWDCTADLSSLFEALPQEDFMKSIKGYVKSYSPVCYMCGTKVRVDVKWISERNCFVSKNERDNCIDELTLDKLPACLEKWVMKYIPIFPVYNDDLDDPKNKKIVRNIASLFSPEVNTYEVYASLIGLERSSRFQSMRKMISSKSGLMEQSVLGKRVNFCMRSVIVPDLSLDIDEVLIPRTAFMRLRLEAGELVLFNRQPSLVRQSILALKVKSRDDDEKVIAFNPCLCGGFNADFDGDEMNLFVTKNHDRELDMMLPQNNLIALRDGKLVIYPHQDTMLGLSFSPEFSDGNTKSKVIKYILDNYRDEDVNMLYKALQGRAYRNLDEQKFSLTSFKSSVQAIIKSGARGSDSNWNYMFRELGLQSISSATRQEAGRSNHITGNLERGLSFDEYFVHMQSTRESICSTGVTTASSGYISKRLSKMLAPLKKEGNKIKVGGVVVT